MGIYEAEGAIERQSPSNSFDKRVPHKRYDRMQHTCNIHATRTQHGRCTMRRRPSEQRGGQRNTWSGRLSGQLLRSRGTVENLLKKIIVPRAAAHLIPHSRWLRADEEFGATPIASEFPSMPMLVQLVREIAPSKLVLPLLDMHRED